MGDLQVLVQRARELGTIVLQSISDGKSIIIVCNYDADGICAATLLAKAIQNKKGKVVVRVVSEANSDLLQQLKEDNYDLHLFCDVGAGLVSETKSMLGDKFIIIDHHSTSDDELSSRNIFNPFQYGFDGGVDATTTYMAYLLASEIDHSVSENEWFTVVASLADHQDQGENHSLLGLNKASLENVLNNKVASTIDLMFYGTGTKPIYEGIATTMYPYIVGLTGSKDACLATLVSCGIPPKTGDSWRTLADLTADEKKKLVDALLPYLTLSSTAESALSQLIGTVYMLVKEDEHSSLHDAREFGILLDACSRIGQAGVAVAICMGDRDQSLREGEKLLTSYRQVLNKYVRSLLGDDERIIEYSKSILLSGDGMVDECMLSPLATILSSISRFHGRVLIVKTATASGQFKISARKTLGSGELSNLGMIFQEVSKMCNGRGGGTKYSAGAKIPISKLETFVKQVNSKL
ncbi:MAG: DHH family phosphoesterase [Thaumarchaeota archaeon]|nr:DHH family phosphoesterase [Nitrososphaerota archaeon]